MAATEYIVRATLKNSLRITSAEFDTLVDDKIKSASRSIDKTTHRRFWLDDAVSARTFKLLGRTVCRRDGTHVLFVPDIGSLAGLVVELGTAGGEIWTPITDYETEPENALAENKAISCLIRTRPWGHGRHVRVRITARWGWPAVPAEVVDATLIQAQRLYRRKDSPEGVAGSAEWGAIRVSRVDPDVENLISHLVLPEFA